MDTHHQMVPMSAEQATQLNNFWFVAAQSHQLKARPLERKINGQRIVLFRGTQGQAHALDARCPHRGANLALGRLKDGCITCPYHGWRFDGKGRVVEIPSEPPSKPVPESFVTRQYQVIEQQGLVWVLPGEKAAAPAPVFNELGESGLHSFSYETVVPIPFDWWIENALDVAHVPYVHGSTYGEQKSVVASYRVERQTDELGFRARTVTSQRYSLLTRLLHRSASHFDMHTKVTFFMPGSVVFDIDLGKGKRQVLLFNSTPEDGQSTRIWITVLRNYLLVPAGDFIGRRFLRAVIAEDIRASQAAVSRVSLAMDRCFNAAADEPSLEFMRLLRLWQARELERA